MRQKRKPPNSTLAGATRSYVGSTHKITGTLSSVVSWDTNKSQTNVYLNKDVFLGNDIEYGSGLLLFYNIGDSSSVTSMYVPDGKFYYFFNTAGLSTNAFTCDTVTMTSY